MPGGAVQLVALTKRFTEVAVGVKTFDPSPWLSHTAWGQVICQLDVTPPASDRRARAARRDEVGWRAMKMRSCSWMMSARLLESSRERAG